MGKLYDLRVLVWGEPAETAAERKLVRKIDFFILTYCCLSFFFNYLDRAALANAYVSGLKEDVGLVGNQYNDLVTCLSVGYIIGQVPHALAIQVVAPRIWFPLMTLIWAGLTMCTAATHNFTQLAALRFFQGMIEASTYSGTQYIIGSWYKPQEVGKRIGLFAASGMAGTMFAGLMMTAIYKTMNGHAGLPGWKWVFIIDGIITLPIAIFGFFSFPDLPETTKAPYFSVEEKALALSRLPPKNPEGHKIGFSIIKRVLLNLNFWIFTLFWVIGGALEAFNTQSCMLLWMKSTKKFTVPQNNDYPLGLYAIGIVLTLLTSIAIDATGKHAPWGIITCVLQIVACIILLCWEHIGNGAKMGAYLYVQDLAATAYAIQPVCFAWATQILVRENDDASRAVILYSMNGASSVLFSFWGIVLYPATDAKKGFHRGTIAMVCIAVLLILWIGIVWMQDKRTVAMIESQNPDNEEKLEDIGMQDITIPTKE
ncbi:Pantothenate transporter [Lachnellula hyalina]|uniref:Pantothenate transporter n=1 Tax=Lachnellula hyalina TaxID=1316788 RepID=A0A8H8R255_9HELO|nr:Pantothenate transporter [Lachnellula hyalina]TVY27122.1 Pantothenate transporter [Lachnellula hyalina]